MKTTIRLFAVLLSIVASFPSVHAQDVDIVYETQVSRIRSKGYSNNSCQNPIKWESESKQEYTTKVWVSDDQGIGPVGGLCLKGSGNRSNWQTYGSNTFLLTATNRAKQLTYKLEAWEDDTGDRCSYNSSHDDCKKTADFSTAPVKIRHGGASNSFTEHGPYEKGKTQLYVDVKFKYTGSAHSFAPNCYSQSVVFNAGGVRSRAVYLTSGVIYTFSKSSSSSDRMTLYRPDGYSQESSTQNTTMMVQTYQTGWHYLELASSTWGDLVSNVTINHISNSCWVAKNDGQDLPDAATNAASLEALPNPFSEQTTLRFSTLSAGPASLEVYDIHGKLVERVFTGEIRAGQVYEFNFHPAGHSAGVYTALLRTANGEILNRKLIQFN